ncbi:MAG: hypothetical protein Unbinned176contig1000_44 [Prokaryotic dsDNA virus sp.]|nr:MAG: hypothetical protein Unbinned176contig1000_44 [Prokaryotic dsDNA virus sp.]|tara:strand:+ start:25052 stop:25558 length:507 start_codon:yes stop_codon:yes gene_type:complete
MADSIRYKTYKNVLETLKCLGDKHKQIKTTTTGDIFDIDLNDANLFPLYHINPISAEINLQQKIFNFQIFVMDIVDADNNNEDYVQSDTFQIVSDLIALLKQGEILYHYDASAGEEPRYFIEDDFTCEPFQERFDNFVTGWTVDIGVIVESELNSCIIPIDNSATCIK